MRFLGKTAAEWLAIEKQCDESKIDLICENARMRGELSFLKDKLGMINEYLKTIKE